MALQTGGTLRHMARWGHWRTYAVLRQVLAEDASACHQHGDDLTQHQSCYARPARCPGPRPLPDRRICDTTTSRGGVGCDWHESYIVGLCGVHACDSALGAGEALAAVAGSCGVAVSPSSKRWSRHRRVAVRRDSVCGASDSLGGALAWWAAVLGWAVAMARTRFLDRSSRAGHGCVPHNALRARKRRAPAHAARTQSAMPS